MPKTVEEKRKYNRKYMQRYRIQERGRIKTHQKKYHDANMVEIRAYHRAYYQKHKEKAQEYQRLYARNKRKSTTRRQDKFAIIYERPAIKRSYSPGDLQHLSAGALAKVANGILSGRLTLAGV